jgi:O-Antigen ligase
MNKVLAFAWLVTIGSNGARSFSQDIPLEGAVILAGGIYFAFAFPRELRRLVFFKDYLFVLSLLVLPILLMLLSDESFERRVYTSLSCVALVFVVASVLALRSDLDRITEWAAFSIVATGVTLNLYELFVANNLWSNAPGRSAGFYVDVNVSASALLGYGLVFLTARAGNLRLVDLILTTLIAIGVFATFSRTGILATLILLTGLALSRVGRENVIRIVIGLVAVSSIAFALVSYVVDNLDLSEDAARRISSLIEAGGIGDFEKDRGAAASAAWDIIVEHPVFGGGVRTVSKMPEGPHNMFLAMMVDYGIFGLIAYLALITRLILAARRAGRELGRPLVLYVGWLLIYSLALHTLLEDAMSILLLGFALARSYRILAPLPNEAARPTTVELCQSRAWCPTDQSTGPLASTCDDWK